MSYSGNGTFLINSAGQPVVPGTTITTTAFNALTADLATGLTTAITKDGQTTPTANIPMGTFKFTGLGAGTAAEDSVRVSQLQAGGTTFLTAAGTDTITATASPSLTAYATGNLFTFVVANTNTGAVTLNVDGLGAKAVTRDGSTALAAADLVATEVVVVIYDGTRFQVINPNAATNYRISGTLTPSSTNGIVGTTTNDNANAGSVGELVSATLASGSAVSLVTATAKTVTSISLTAGDWDVTGVVNMFFDAATNVVAAYGGASTTNNTLGANNTFTGTLYSTTGSVLGNTLQMRTTVPTQRISIASTTTVYLIAFCSFTVSTTSAHGEIRARRVR
jgi:hypothetical protein